MTLQMGITMAVLIFMIISFFVGKYSYGLISMTCVIILTLTGVVTPESELFRSGKKENLCSAEKKWFCSSSGISWIQHCAHPIYGNDSDNGVYASGDSDS